MSDLTAAAEALGAADWGRAHELYAAALEEEESPEALYGLGQALWWLGRNEEGVELRRRAYTAFRRRGDTRRAAWLAAYIAVGPGGRLVLEPEHQSRSTRMTRCSVPTSRTAASFARRPSVRIRS